MCLHRQMGNAFHAEQEKKFNNQKQDELALKSKIGQQFNREI